MAYTNLKPGKLYRVANTDGISLHMIDAGFYQAQAGEIVMFLKQKSFMGGISFHWLYQGKCLSFIVWDNTFQPNIFMAEIDKIRFMFDEVDLLLETPYDE